MEFERNVVVSCERDGMWLRRGYVVVEVVLAMAVACRWWWWSDQVDVSVISSAKKARLEG
ncbi:hypothetical protein E2C01_054384 [Portunus trituberculatus]|uniref:Transmembrane protein n=1 Tax=Portunus trituberculatus TaxID=210409 RepID=A0A5B7GNB9_PORTR|nr:hypothetical protein [Portunus trituberculatus]